MADEQTTVYAVARDGNAITDWRDTLDGAQQDAAAIAESMTAAKLTPDVEVVTATRTVSYTAVQPATPPEVSDEGVTDVPDPAPATDVAGTAQTAEVNIDGGAAVDAGQPEEQPADQAE
jgi:hypothetical protein